MSANTITLPGLSELDVREIGFRVRLLHGYTRALKAGMGLAPCDALQPAALLAGLHGLNNELGGIVASMAPPAGSSAVSGAATVMICNAITEAADQINKTLHDTSYSRELSIDAVADKLGEVCEAVKSAGDCAEWAGKHAKEGLEAVSVSLDCVARDIRGSTSETVYARVDEVLEQQRMAQATPRRVAKGRCK